MKYKYITRDYIIFFCDCGTELIIDPEVPVVCKTCKKEWEMEVRVRIVEKEK